MADRLSHHQTTWLPVSQRYPLLLNVIIGRILRDDHMHVKNRGWQRQERDFDAERGPAPRGRGDRREAYSGAGMAPSPLGMIPPVAPVVGCSILVSYLKKRGFSRPQAGNLEPNYLGCFDMSDRCHALSEVLATAFPHSGSPM